jgi:hypothetical protein
MLRELIERYGEDAIVTARPLMLESGETYRRGARRRQLIEKRAHLMRDLRQEVRQAAQRLACLSDITHPKGFLGLVCPLDQLVSITDQLAQTVNLVGHTATLAPVSHGTDGLEARRAAAR